MNGFDCSIDDASNLLTSLHSFCVWVHFLSLALSTTLSVRGPSLVPSTAGTSRISRGKLHNKQNSFEYERVEAQMIQILPLAASVDCSMDNFCMSSMGKLNRKSGLPNVVAKDFFTKWLLFADALASFDEPSTNWMDVLPGKIGMAKAHKWELRGRKVYWYRYGQWACYTHQHAISSLHRPFFYDNHRMWTASVDAFWPSVDCYSSAIATSSLNLALVSVDKLFINFDLVWVNKVLLYLVLDSIFPNLSNSPEFVCTNTIPIQTVQLL